ncbi:MAG TPA: hypothetical protein VJU15_14075 [Gemmatimonadales bacterium]|nr:hypothetical protein [Gemmatimonadales bacterium]
MKDSELRAAYHELFRERPAGREACPSPERIVALIERTTLEEERLATLDHVMGCPACKPDFDLMRTIAEGRPAPRRRTAMPLAAAAAVLLLVSGVLLFSVLRARTPGAAGVRGETNGVELISPRGDAHDRPITFTWRKAAGQARYALEVFTPAGGAVYSKEVNDTSVVLPSTVSLQAGTTYHWGVLVRMSDGSAVRTPPIAFTP